MDVVLSSDFRTQGWRINQQFERKLQFLGTKSNALFRACDINSLTNGGKARVGEFVDPLAAPHNVGRFSYLLSAPWVDVWARLSFHALMKHLR
jgi:hypothetical protein